MKNLLIIIISLFGISSNSLAQDRCGTSSLDSKYQLQNPNLRAKKVTMEDKVQSIIREKRLLNNALTDDIVTIPIVFHVLYSQESENVEIEKLTSQVDVLNLDFRRKNDDKNDLWSQAADAKIRFCLSNVDIDGNYFNGITRTFTDVEYFEYGKDSIFLSAKGGKDIWPGYLNIYVCDLGLYSGQNIGAYSSLPHYEPYIDGIVLDYRVTGLFGEFIWPYIGGRTATHEVGHWLNLEHLWGPTEDFSCINQDDGVKDTPFSYEPYYNCDEGRSCESEDMAENFMEYRDDYCLNLFTKGQVERMHASIETYPSRSFLKMRAHNCCINCTRINIKYPIQNEIERVTAIDTVWAINSITGGAGVEYRAGKVVILENDFMVDKSSTFFAGIKAKR